MAAVHFDPSQPVQPGQLTYAILYAYFLYSGVLAAASYGRPPGVVAQLVQHAIDIGTVGLVMHFTVGPTSPFFVFFTFALLTATLRWHWEGAVATAAVLVLGFLIYSYMSGGTVGKSGSDLYDPIIRGVYLFVAGIMLAYVGVFRQRSRDRLAKLAAWPPEEIALADEPELCRSLAHAANVLQTERVLIVWEEAEEPIIHTVLWNGESCETCRDWSPASQELISAELEGACFMAPDPACGWIELNTGRRRIAGRVIAEELVQAFDIRAFATAAFKAGRYRGRVFILDPHRFSEGLLSLTEIVALRIGVELDHFGLRRDLATAARAQERAQLARDIHDGILQDLTAADLQLKAMIPQVAAKSRDQLTAISKLIACQQGRIRSFVDTVTQKPSPAGAADFSSHIRRFAEQLGDQWSCRLELQLDPPELQPPADLGYHICLMLAEATANAVRHGGASRVGVAIRRAAASLEIAIGDNGRGLAKLDAELGLQASPEPLGSNSLRQRVRDLGGSFKLENSPVGLGLSISLPVQP